MSRADMGFPAPWGIQLGRRDRETLVAQSRRIFYTVLRNRAMIYITLDNEFAAMVMFGWTGEPSRGAAP